MRLVATVGDDTAEIIGELFAIDGTSDQFAVHASVGIDYGWSATHMGTGFRLARGDSIDEAIANAREAWAQKTPEEIAAIKERAGAKVGVRVLAAQQIGGAA